MGSPTRWLAGLGVTLTLALGAGVVALLMSALAGTGCLSRRRAIVWLCRAYITTFRGTSALIQLYWGYYVLPLMGLPLDAYTVGIGVLGLNAGAYGAEAVRGALSAVANTQWEAAQVLGLSRHFTFTRIVWPQALAQMLPPLNNVIIELVKNTSLASLITLADITFEAQTHRNATLRSAEAFGILLIAYFVLTRAVAFTFRHLERRSRAQLGLHDGARP